MQRSQPIRWLVLSLLGLLALVAITGCGGGGTSNGIDIRYPGGDPTKDGSISGTVAALVDGGISFPALATVSLERLVGGTYVSAGIADVQSSINGGYQFSDIPAGTYRVTATVAPPNAATTLTNAVAGVAVTGGRPTLMADVLVGDPNAMVTFTGLVTNQSAPIAGATVCFSIAGNNDKEIVISTTTDANGRYTLPIPNNGTSYIISAYGSNTRVYVSDPIQATTGTQTVPDIQLETTNAPGFISPVAYVMATTLPAPTFKGYEDAATTKLAIARAANASPSRLAALEAQATTKDVTRSMATGSILENEVIALSTSYDPLDTYGYKVFRATRQNGTFDYIGETRDGTQVLFTDNDPTLSFDTPAWYTLAAYTANGVMSKAAPPVQATPLPSIEVTGDGNTDGTADVVTGNATLSWKGVNGARSYVVLIYTEHPGVNVTENSTLSPYAMPASKNSVTISQKGTFWWSVTAYNLACNTNNPKDLAFTFEATAAAYSQFYKVTVQ